MIKTKPSFEEESKLWDSNIDYVIGIDEVGRGAFAGPIAAAGVVFHPKIKIGLLAGVNDSKLVKPLFRRRLSDVIKQNALYWTIQQVDISFINKQGIGKANSAVFRKVIKDLIKQIDGEYFVLIDGFHRRYLPGGLKRQKGIVKGDQKSLSIAAASILAKVYRDDLMIKMNDTYPAYGFARNKGYGTDIHRGVIKKMGPTDFHRISFLH